MRSANGAWAYGEITRGWAIGWWNKDNWMGVGGMHAPPHLLSTLAEMNRSAPTLTLSVTLTWISAFGPWWGQRVNKARASEWIQILVSLWHCGFERWDEMDRWIYCRFLMEDPVTWRCKHGNLRIFTELQKMFSLLLRGDVFKIVFWIYFNTRVE